MYDGRNTLSINVVVVDEEEEAKDDEMQLQSVPVQKCPLADCYIYSEITTKHSCQ